MSLSMYQSSIPVFISNLSNLQDILEKAVQYSEDKQIDAEVLPNARLFPNMFPLIKQVQIACDMAKFGAARLAGVEAPKFDDSEKTLPELIERCAKTVEFISGIPVDAVNGTEDKSITIQMRTGPLHFKGMPYLLGFVLPNLYFHTATAYNILRHNGVDIGKQDFLGKLA